MTKKKKEDFKGRVQNHTDKAERPYIDRYNLINRLMRVAV